MLAVVESFEDNLERRARRAAIKCLQTVNHYTAATVAKLQQ